MQKTWEGGEKKGGEALQREIQHIESISKTALKKRGRSEPNREKNRKKVGSEGGGKKGRNGERFKWERFLKGSVGLGGRRAQESALEWGEQSHK